MRKAPVARHGRNLEVDRPLAEVRVPVLLESMHEASHRLEIFRVGRPWRFLDLFEAKSPRVLPKRGDVLIGVGAKVHAGFLRAENRSNVHVREVDDLTHIVSIEVAESSPQYVDAHER